ncbi:hypothetical protein QPK14_21220 [Photorhabdus temperata subsp. temperata]
MSPAIRRYLIAAGSIMNIMPATNYRKLVSSVSDSEKIRNDVAAISKDIVNVLDTNRACRQAKLLDHIK